MSHTLTRRRFLGRTASVATGTATGAALLAAIVPTNADDKAVAAGTLLAHPDRL
jgi:hypothetical protein